MITIKSGSYTRKEIKLLGELFGEMEKTLLTQHCSDKYKCTICPIRHICDAIHSANEFINQK